MLCSMRCQMRTESVIFDDFKGRDVFEPIIPRGTPFPNETVFSKTFYLARRTDGSYIDFADIGLYISEEGGPDGATLYKDFGVTASRPTLGTE